MYYMCISGLAEHIDCNNDKSILFLYCKNILYCKNAYILDDIRKKK